MLGLFVCLEAARARHCPVLSRRQLLPRVTLLLLADFGIRKGHRRKGENGEGGEKVALHGGIPREGGSWLEFGTGRLSNGTYEFKFCYHRLRVNH